MSFWKRGPARAVRKRLEPSTPPAASTGPTAASGVDVAQLGVKKLRPNDHGSHGIWIAFLWKLRWDELWYICFAWLFVMGDICGFSVNYTVHLLKTVETQRCRCWRGGSICYKEACLQYLLSIHIEVGIPLCHDGMTFFFPTTPVTAIWNFRRVQRVYGSCLAEVNIPCSPMYDLEGFCQDRALLMVSAENERKFPIVF